MTQSATPSRSTNNKVRLWVNAITKTAVSILSIQQREQWHRKYTATKLIVISKIQNMYWLQDKQDRQKFLQVNDCAANLITSWCFSFWLYNITLRLPFRPDIEQVPSTWDEIVAHGQRLLYKKHFNPYGAIKLKYVSELRFHYTIYHSFGHCSISSKGVPLHKNIHFINLLWFSRWWDNFSLSKNSRHFIGLWKAITMYDTDRNMHVTCKTNTLRIMGEIKHYWLTFSFCDHTSSRRWEVIRGWWGW